MTSITRSFHVTVGHHKACVFDHLGINVNLNGINKSFGN